MGGHGHANYMQMTCKPTQDLPGVSGAVEGEESAARSPGGWWGYAGPSPTVRKTQLSLRGQRFGVGMGVPEHQPWFCCWLRKSRTWPQDSRRKAGTHRAARQSKAHAEREGICPGSYNKAERGRENQNPGLLSQVEARVPERPKLHTVKYTDKERNRKQADQSLIPGLRTLHQLVLVAS